MPADRYLLTGSTGFLGREVLVRLLHAGRPTMVTMRRRTPDDTLASVTERIEQIVRQTDPDAPLDGLRVAFGDVSQPRLGLDAQALEWLRDGRAHLVHGAAQVRFDKPWSHMFEQNVEGTQHAIDLALALAEEGHLQRLDYVSTTYVAGARGGLALETEVDVGQRFRNDYERSKLAAERRVERARVAGLPITVSRPSIIVGDSRTGKAGSFKVLYWPLKLYARGRWRVVFGRPDCIVDVVPVDFVADALVALLDEPEAAGKTVHLAAGPERQSTIGEVVTLAQHFFHQKPIIWFDLDLYLKYFRRFVRPIIRRLRPEVGELGGVYLPYLKENPSFSVDVATRFLAPRGIQPPRVSDYFDAILRYARETDFGRLLPRDP